MKGLEPLTTNLVYVPVLTLQVRVTTCFPNGPILGVRGTRFLILTVTQAQTSNRRERSSLPQAGSVFSLMRPSFVEPRSRLCDRSGSFSLRNSVDGLVRMMPACRRPSNGRTETEKSQSLFMPPLSRLPWSLTRLRAGKTCRG